MAEEKKEWWPPSWITFTVAQVMFLLENYFTIRDGSWPPEARETGYIGEDQVRSQRAPFEDCCQVWAELSFRLDRTGIEGELLLAEVQSGIGLEGLRFASRQALKYISGQRRKALSYSRWKAQRAYRIEHKKVFI